MEMIDCPLLHISDPVPVFKGDHKIKLSDLKFNDDERQGRDTDRT